MIWSALSRLALIGTDQTNIPEKVLDILAARGIETQNTPDQILLDGVAVFNQMRKAGFVLEDFKGAIPSKAGTTAPTSICSPRSIRHLRKILSGVHQAALADFLDLMVQNKKQLPPEFLPEIFNLCLTEASLWSLIAPRLDERALWLLPQNPDWISLLAPVHDYNWDTAKPSEKKAIFYHLHQVKPIEANTFLQHDWLHLDYKEKLDFLALLAHSVVASDETFLEWAREDKRKEVRYQAAVMLSRLPDSVLSKHLFKLAQQYFIPDPKRLLRIQLPEAVPTETTQDGIDLSKAEKHFKSGLKAAWLAALVSRIPPSKWEGLLETTPRNIIAAFQESHLSDVLAIALVDAIRLHQDSIWAENLIRYETGSGLPNQWTSNQLKELIELLGPTTFNDIIHSHLQYNGPMLEEETHLITRMLISASFPWDERLSKLIISGFQQWMTETQVFYWNLLHYHKLLEAAAYCIPPHLVDAFSRDWPYHSPIWPRWEAAIQRFLQTLSFRKEMEEELRKSVITGKNL
ncbi:MAG: DUF5691 domain-containing protein [Saprospiraceae bacterium]